MRQVKYIIVHCSATPEGRPVSAEDIDRWHRERHFKCIGYHYVIGLLGEIWVGRPLNEVGAHCLGFNQCSIGVCYVGGCDCFGKSAKDTRTTAQKRSLRSLLKDLKKLYPTARIVGHRDLAKTECPAFDAKKEYGSL